MKDFNNNELMIGDAVAYVYHPEAYVFETRRAVITEFIKNDIVIKLDPEIEKRTRPNKEGLYNKIVKIANKLSAETENVPQDILHQPVEIGDRVAYRLPIELGNTFKGFAIAGIVRRITAKCVFVEDATNPNRLVRRSLTNIVVVA